MKRDVIDEKIDQLVSSQLKDKKTSQVNLQIIGGNKFNIYPVKYQKVKSKVQKERMLHLMI